MKASRLSLASADAGDAHDPLAIPSVATLIATSTAEMAEALSQTLFKRRLRQPDLRCEVFADLCADAPIDRFCRSIRDLLVDDPVARR